MIDNGNDFRAAGPCPLFAGGLVRAANPQASPDQVVAALTSTAVPLPSLSGKVVTGGRVDAARAIGFTAR